MEIGSGDIFLSVALDTACKFVTVARKDFSKGRGHIRSLSAVIFKADDLVFFIAESGLNYDITYASFALVGGIGN